MKVLIKERLSPNKYVTSEGYLICKDAILARTGKQQYRKSEVFDTFDGDDDIIDIDRNPKEVFSDTTLASFENKPITVEHPQENVDSTNWKQYQVGFVRDVKRGVVDGQDVILGTLVIQDKDTIDEILNGEHTDLSCGYECDITGDDKTGYSQINIRGNHVALCQEGRAGIARIVDSKIEDDTHTYYSTIRNQKFKIKGLPNHRIKMIYEDGKEEEKKESYFKELLQKQIIRIVDSKVEDSVNDSEELVVGKWYEFAKKIEVARNQYAKSLRISGKSGNVYKYTIYLKNGEVYGSGTYSEIKERFNIKDAIVDSKVEDVKFVVYNEDDDFFGRFDTKEEAKKQIKELKAFDKRQGNPFDEVYRIEIEDSVEDSVEDDFYDKLFSSNLKYEFIKGGYGIKFKTQRDYQNAKEIAKRTHYTKGKWYDKDLEFFEYGGITISNEDSIYDSDNIVDSSIKLREVRSGYAVVVRKYYENYGLNAFVDRVCDDLNEAKYVRNSLERADRMSFAIIDCNNRAYRVVDSKGDKDMKDSINGKLKGNGEVHFIYKGSKIHTVVYNRNNKSSYELNSIAKKYGCNIESIYYNDVFLVCKVGNEENLLKAFSEINPTYSFSTLMNLQDSVNDDCNNTDCDDALVEEPKAKDELIKALSDYKLTDEGKTFTGRTHCQFESTKKFDRPGFDKEVRRIIALVKNIENKYNIPDTTYNIGMRNDGTIVAVVDLGRKYVEDSKIKDSIKHSTLINLTKIVKVIKNNKDNR